MKKYLWTALALLVFSCKDNGNPISPLVQDITESIYASGTVKSKNQYELHPTINAIIKEILVTEGDIVRKGDVILTLVNETPKLNVEIARLSAIYGSERMNSEKLNILKENIALARSKMANDSALFIRQQNLWNQGIGTRMELEQKELLWKSASSLYHSYLLQYDDLRKQIEFDAKRSLKNYQLSSSVAEDYILRAKADGKVYSLLKKEGEIATLQTPLAVIGDARSFILELDIDEYDIARINPGQSVFVTMDSYKGQVFEGNITKIDPIMNKSSRSFQIEVCFVKQPPNLYPNLTAEANILISTKKNALTIPRAYLIGENYVEMKNGKHQEVVTGLKDYERVEIISGLTKNDIIVKTAP